MEHAMSFTEQLLAGAASALKDSAFARREAAATLAPSPIGRDRDWNLSAAQGGSWAFRPFSPGDWEQNTAEIQRAQNLAVKLYYSCAMYRSMLRLPASYIAGTGVVTWKAKHPAVQELLNRLSKNQANTLLHYPRRDYIRWRLFGMSPYLIETLPTGEIQANWWDPRTFAGCSWHNRNDGLMDEIRLGDSARFIEGVVELSPQPGNRGEPMRIVKVKTPQGQTFYSKGVTSTHRVIRVRSLPDSSRSAFDMALLGPEWDQLMDGTALVLLSNTEGSSLGSPDYIATFDDLTRYRSSWNDEIDRVRGLRDVVWKYFYRGQPTEELLRMRNEGWKPEARKALILPFMNSPGDMADLKQETIPIGSGETSQHFNTFKQEIITDTLLPMTWFSSPEQRVLAALAQESPAVMTMAASQADLKEAWERFGRYAVDTARMWRWLPLRASPEFEAVMQPLRAEDAAAHIDRLIKLAQFVATAKNAGTLDGRIGSVLIREALATENVIDLERFMRVLGLGVNDPLPLPAQPENPLFSGGPEETPAVMTKSGKKMMAVTVTEENILRLARKSPKAIAALIPGLRVLATVKGNGHGKSEQEDLALKELANALGDLDEVGRDEGDAEPAPKKAGPGGRGRVLEFIRQRMTSTS